MNFLVFLIFLLSQTTFAKSDCAVHLRDHSFLGKAFPNTPETPLPVVRKMIETIIREENRKNDPFIEKGIDFVRARRNNMSGLQMVNAYPIGAKFSRDGEWAHPMKAYYIIGNRIFEQPTLAEFVVDNLVYEFKDGSIVSRENLSKFAIAQITDETIHLIRVVGLREYEFWEKGNIEALKKFGNAGPKYMHFNVGTAIWDVEPDMARFDAHIPTSLLRKWINNDLARIGWHQGNLISGEAGIEIILGMDTLDELSSYLKIVGEKPITKYAKNDSVLIMNGLYKGKYGTVVSVRETKPRIKYQIAINGPSGTSFDEFEENLGK